MARLGYIHHLSHPPGAGARPRERDITLVRDVTLVLHVEGAPAIRLTFDSSDPFDATRARLTIDDQAPVVAPDSVAQAVEIAAGTLLTFWTQRSAWPPDVRPTQARPAD